MLNANKKSPTTESTKTSAATKSRGRVREAGDAGKDEVASRVAIASLIELFESRVDQTNPRTPQAAPAVTIIIINSETVKTLRIY